MKVSDLIKEIVELAEEKFGRSGHLNDCVSVWVFAAAEADGHFWQVGLERPSQNHLDRGEVDRSETVKLTEVRTAFHCESDNLLDALEQLLARVEDAYGDELLA